VKIPIVDIFAGPGGLGEGFSAFLNPETNQREFKIALSIEKDFYAHQTLNLRSFFRQFNLVDIPSDYYEFIKGKISLKELFHKWPEYADSAKNEAWRAELGDSKEAVSNDLVDKKIQAALNGQIDWLLIGGPPCQAYSVAGRVRRQEKILDEKKDERVGLYKQYLRILAIHSPTVFVMENVKGLLSAKTKENQVFSKLLLDLANPVKAYLSEFKRNGVELNCPGYRIYSLVAEPKAFDNKGNPIFQHKDFVIHSENFGIPQTRHRLILLGVRKDIDFQPKILESQTEVHISSVLKGLPKLRSTLTEVEDNGDIWKSSLQEILAKDILSGIDKGIKEEIIKQLDKISVSQKGTGGEFILCKKNAIEYRPEWFLDENLGGICNHSSRAHMKSDLHRYLFVSSFAQVKYKSPMLNDFPLALLPAHKNVRTGILNKKFADRFRVQIWNKPGKTITSHISQDGHYYIHPDPVQCRSFTVREAARIQTFPDNYYFCGPRTSQYIQVGNAVPPLLANQIAGIVWQIFDLLKIKHSAKFESKLMTTI
jgi:DNA (cytosine-5)-methyltransferase 1